MTWLWWTAIIGVSSVIVVNVTIMIASVVRYRRMDKKEQLLHDFRKELDLWDSSLFLEDADIKEDS